MLNLSSNVYLSSSNLKAKLLEKYDEIMKEFKMFDLHEIFKNKYMDLLSDPYNK